MLKAYDEGNTFAKVLVQVKADKDLKDSIVVRFPFGPFKELVYTEVDVEYEWKSARCGTCLVFGHDGKSCPKSFWNDEKVVETPTLDKDDGKEESIVPNDCEVVGTN
ncbi:hypothetical protein Tco_1550509, partial [Tanacetum coccineum]